MAIDLQRVLPPHLGSEALDVSVLQDAMLKLEEYQQQARTSLFKKLARYALQGSETDFEAQLDQLCQTTGSFAADTPETYLIQSAQQYRQLCQQEYELLETEAAAQADADIRSQVLEFTSLMSQGQLTEAAWCLQRLRKTVHESGQAAQHHADDMSVRSALDVSAHLHVQQCQECETQLLQTVEDVVSASIRTRFDGRQGSLALVEDSSSQHLRHADILTQVVTCKEAWSALGPLNQLQSRMEALSASLLQDVLRPLLNPRNRWIATQSGEIAGSKKQAMICVFVDDSNGDGILQTPSSQQDVTKPCEGCRQVLHDIADIVFQLDEQLVRGLGDVLWPSLCDACLEVYVQPYAAAAANQPIIMQWVSQAVAELEDWANNMGFVDGNQLQRAVSGAICQAESRLQVAPLAAARATLLADLTGAGETVWVGQALPIDHPLYERLLSGRCPEWEASDPGAGLQQGSGLLQRGQYRLGQGGLQLEQLVHQVLQQACNAGSQASTVALVHSLKKIALLARSLPEAEPRIRQQLFAVLPLALIHHNTLVHLSDTLLLAMPAYAPTLEPQMNGEGLGLMEPALLLRYTAEQLLQQLVSSQIAMFQELVRAELQGFRKLGRAAGPEGLAAYRKTVAQILHTLNRLGRVLVDHLSPDALLHVASSVLQGLCSQLVGDIMAKSDIGIDDCKELRDLLGPIAQQALNVIIPTPSQTPGSEDQPPSISGIPVAVVREAVHASCSPLRQLAMLLELLDAGLKDLLAAWEARKMQECGFTADDAIHLLCALFEPSEYRRDAISRIRASAW